jgi:hypothetical protein
MHYKKVPVNNLQPRMGDERMRQVIYDEVVIS